MILHSATAGDGPPMVILHGMLGQGRNWLSVGRLLSPRFRVITLDLRNHGQSPRGEPMDYHAMAADVAETMEHNGIGATAAVGHSMGGKVAMTLALTQPQRVRRLAVVDTAPVDYPPQNLPLVRALRAVDLAQARGRADVDLALRAAVPDNPTRAFLLQGLQSSEDGLTWKCDLEIMERYMPALSGFPVFGPQTTYPGPTLFVAGARSDHIRPEHERRIALLFPGWRIVRVRAAGHWVHADQPQAMATVLTEFVGQDVPPRA